MHAIETAKMIEDLYPSKFKFKFLRDEGITERLEVTLFFNTHDLESKGFRVHSKNRGDGLPSLNWAF